MSAVLAAAPGAGVLVVVKENAGRERAETGYADWLIDDCYQHVGDLAETIALMLPRDDDSREDTALHVWMEARLPSLGRMESAERIEVQTHELVAEALEQ